MAFVLALGLALPTSGWAQGTAGTTAYRSEIDQLLTIQKIGIFGISDNLQGIYARPLEAHLKKLLEGNHRWDFVEMNNLGPLATPDELTADSGRVQRMFSGSTADAALSAKVTRGPAGLSIELALYLKRDGKLLAQAENKDAKLFEVKDAQEQLEILLGKLFAQIPYQGRILSRDAQRVTLNMGKRDGLEGGNVIPVIQIIAAERHPKFGFIVSTEKEILGRVRLVKVEETLSFGVIIAEREKGAIEKGSKVAGLDFITYPEVTGFAPDESDKVGQRPDSPISFGDSPKAWVPQRAPSFGQVGARMGLSHWNANTRPAGIDALDASTILAPNIFLEGELWVTQEFSVHAQLRHAIAPIDNPRPGSSPATLNQSLTHYELLFGYNWRLQNSIWGPTVTALVGYLNHKVFVDDASPEAFTTQEYTGLKGGAQGLFPVSADGRWSGGAALFMVFFPKLNETPVTSGAKSKNQINIFSLIGSYKWRENLRLQGNLDFELYSSNFTGSGSRTEDATSASHRITTLSAGIYYLF